jgi:ABC-2 type transport system permease protein
MSTQPDAIRESSLDAQAVATANISFNRRLYWSVRREFWENRSIYLAPLAAAALVLVGFFISAIHLPARMRAAISLSPLEQHRVIEQPYQFAELLLMATMLIVAVFYCLDALHGERRDRSILFWKSLPVSDLATVVAKASIPLLIMPLLTFAITVVTQWIMLLLSSVVLAGSGVSPAILWNQLPMFQMSMGLLFHLVGVHGLWYGPFYAWMLLVSGWARRAPFVWAALPLVAVGIGEKIAFNTSHFGSLLGYVLGGGPQGRGYIPAGMSMHPLAHVRLADFLGSPGLWIALAVTAAFLAGAVKLRRYQGPI